MAGKKKSMKDIKQLIIMYRQKMPIRDISRKLEMSRNTIKKYLAKFKSLELDFRNNKSDFDLLMSLEEEAIEKELFSGNPSFKGKQYEDFTNELEYLKKELKEVGVTRQLLTNAKSNCAR